MWKNKLQKKSDLESVCTATMGVMKANHLQL